ncbi:SpoIIE family protein phosphatase [Kitasatospora sp. NPDC001159]
MATPVGARVILGDVQGKGLPAVSMAAAVVGCFREVAFHEEDLATVASRLEERLLRQNQLAAQLGGREERFATAVVIRFPDDVPDRGTAVAAGQWCADRPRPAGGRAPGSPAVRLAEDETALIAGGVTEASTGRAPSSASAHTWNAWPACPADGEQRGVVRPATAGVPDDGGGEFVHQALGVGGPL